MHEGIENSHYQARGREVIVNGGKVILTESGKVKCTDAVKWRRLGWGL
jgi:hypothetical protein